MSWDEEPERRPAKALDRPNFERWNLGELRDYIAALREEIHRAEEAIKAKDSARSAAESVFRTP